MLYAATKFVPVYSKCQSLSFLNLFLLCKIFIGRPHSHPLYDYISIVTFGDGKHSNVDDEVSVKTTRFADTTMDEIRNDDYSNDASTSNATTEYIIPTSTLRNSSGSTVASEMSSGTRLADLESTFATVNGKILDVTSKLDKLFIIMSTHALNSPSSPKGGGEQN